MGVNGVQAYAQQMLGRPGTAGVPGCAEVDLDFKCVSCSVVPTAKNPLGWGPKPDPIPSEPNVRGEGV